MYYLGALWLGGLFGWLACSMLVRRSLEIENNHLRREIDRMLDARGIAENRAYDQGKRDAGKRL
jgi:hypothetical protein